VGFSTDPAAGGPGFYALERAALLAGSPQARVLYYAEQIYGGIFTPTDLEGPPPPAGSPNDLYQWYPTSPPVLLDYKIHVDWANPALSTLAAPVGVPVGAVDTAVAPIPQPGGGAPLDARADRLMRRAVYRNFGDHTATVLNRTVTSQGTAAIAWYELRNIHAGVPTLYQQGVYNPADGLHRWLGSIGQDAAGNIALGFNTGSASAYAGLRYTGRQVDDGLGQLPRGEGSLVTSSGALQGWMSGGVTRWGDYANLVIDPTDGCTFWATGEYVAAPTAMNGWGTYIGSFRFPNCPPLPREAVTWIHQVAVTAGPGADANTITHGSTAPSWTGAGAISSRVIASGAGYAEAEVPSTGHSMFGLGNGDTDQDYHDIDYAVEFEGTYLKIFENGTLVHEGGWAAPGDRVQVQVTPAQVSYARNGIVFYQHATTPLYPLGLDTSLYEAGSQVIHAYIGGTTLTTRPDWTVLPVLPREAVSWTHLMGVTVGTGTEANTLTRGPAAPSWTSAGAVSTRAIQSGAGYAEAEVQNTGHVMFGLNNGDKDQSYSEIDYAVEFEGLYLKIFESGTLVHEAGWAQPGDKVAVLIQTNHVYYYRNGGLLYDHATTPVYPLGLDTSLYEAGSQVVHAYLAGTSLGSP
jgi:hypothetical protein